MAESNEQPQVSKGFTNSGGLSGAALKRMQELAQSLYDSTPGLQEGISFNPITYFRVTKAHFKNSIDS